MSGLSRRQFLGSSLALTATGIAWPQPSSGADTPAATSSSPASGATSVGEKSTVAKVLEAAGGRLPPKPALLTPSRPRDTLLLTWSGDPTTSVTIQWLGSSTTTITSIAYAAVSLPIWQSAPVTTHPYPHSDLRVYRAELTGLKPGTEYQFLVDQQSPLLVPYRFRTMPAKATDTFTFVSGGDAGTGSAPIASHLIAARQEPYFVLMGGDLAYDNGRDPDVFTRFLMEYSRHLVDRQGRLVPLVSCIGNHEVNGGFKGRRTDAGQYLSFFDGFYREKTFGVLDIGDYLSLVLLDTDHIAPIEGEQTEWLAATLAARQERPHLIVANHVPAYPSNRSPTSSSGKPGTGALQRQHWSPLFERYNVDVVLEHHDHTFKRTHPLTNGLIDKHGVLYLGDGSWGKLRTPNPPEKRPYLARASEAYHVTVHRLEGEQRFHVALEGNGKIADVCMTAKKRPAIRG